MPSRRPARGDGSAPRPRPARTRGRSLTMDWTRVPVVVGRRPADQPRRGPRRGARPLRAHGGRRPARRGRHRRRRPAPPTGRRCSPDLTHLFMVHSLSLRHGDPAAELARRLGADAGRGALLGHGRVDPPVAREPGRRAGGRRAASPASSSPGPRPSPPAGAPGSWGSSSTGRPREGWPDTWPPLEPDLGRAPRRAGPRAGAGHHHVRAGGVGRGPRRRATTPPPTAPPSGDLMARFNAVAVANPVSWFPTRRDARGDHDGHRPTTA